jgi:glycosyltransferase involved in cell wall biosynthesis
LTGKEIDVVLVNDGSNVEIHEGVDFLKKEIGTSFNYVSYLKNRGKGGALKAGVLSLDSDYYLFTDIDFPYHTESMKNVYDAILANGSIVTGYREELYYEEVTMFRKLLSKALRVLNKGILGLPTNDTQCGLKAFDKAVKDILLTCSTERFLIDLELLLSVNSRKMSIYPVKVKLRDDVVFTKFNPSVLVKELFSLFKLILKYRVFNF